MGVMFTLIGVGFLVLFGGLIGSADPSVRTTSMQFAGILLMAVGILGSAVLSAVKRSRERAVRAKEARAEEKALARRS